MDKPMYTIGAVAFGVRRPAGLCAPADCYQADRDHIHYVPLMGDRRRDMLQRVLDRLPLAPGWVIVGQVGLSAWAEITPDQIRWDTSGLTPTPRV